MRLRVCKHAGKSQSFDGRATLECFQNQNYTSIKHNFLLAYCIILPNKRLALTPSFPALMLASTHVPSHQMIDQSLTTHPACVNPSVCEAKYKFALKLFAFGVARKRDANFPEAITSLQGALALLQGALPYMRGWLLCVGVNSVLGPESTHHQLHPIGCCHANAGVLQLSVAFRLAETRMRAHHFQAAIDGATWCLQVAQWLGVGSSINHQILLVRGLALLSLGQHDAALQDIKAGCHALPNHRREQGAACLQHIYQALAQDDSSCSSQEFTPTTNDDDEVTSAPLPGAESHVKSPSNKRLRL